MVEVGNMGEEEVRGEGEGEEVVKGEDACAVGAKVGAAVKLEKISAVSGVAAGVAEKDGAELVSGVEAVNVEGLRPTGI